MHAELVIDTSAIILISSTLIGFACFSITYIFVKAVLEMDEYRIAAWHREETRWKTLRSVSSTFRYLQRGIIGLAQIIEIYFPWFIELPKPANGWLRFGSLIFQLFFGNSNRLSQAVKVQSAVAPWNTAEFSAGGMIISAFIVIFVALEVIHRQTSFQGYLLLLFGWLFLYRIWSYWFISSGERRRSIIRRFLPHAMDSIAMVMSSGGTFRAGMDSVIRDFPEHPLCQEFIRLRNELDRGQVMTEALQTIASSICLPEFDEMVRVLARVHQHGTPGSEAFVRLAKQLRISHLRHLEEEVGRAEATMALPTMLVMASCMVIAVAPFILSILKSSFVASLQDL